MIILINTHQTNLSSSMAESHSSGLGQPSLWTDRERRLWIMVLFGSSILIYAGRGALPVSMVEMSSDLSWDKRICVCNKCYVIILL